MLKKLQEFRRNLKRIPIAHPRTLLASRKGAYGQLVEELVEELLRGPSSKTIQNYPIGFHEASTIKLFEHLKEAIP